MFVTLPFLMLLLDWWPLRRGAGGGACRAQGTAAGWRRLVAEKLPLFLLAAASCLATLRAQQHGGALRPLDDWPIGYRLANALTGYEFYLEKTIYPNRLAILYPAPASIPVVETWAAAALLLTVTAIAIGQRSRRPYLLCGWFWFLGTLVPVIGLVQVGFQAHADRYSYFPLIGIFIAFAGLLDEVRQRRRPGYVAVTVFASLAIAACIVLTRNQVRVWRDSETLWKNAVRVTDDNFTANWNLGVYYWDKGRIEDGINCLREATRIASNADMHVRFARRLVRIGHQCEAQEQLRAALKIDPQSADAKSMLADVSKHSHGRPMVANPK
jgi:tetratricopeptide (TPR) repeat protein